MKTLDMIKESLTSKTILGGIALLLGFVIKDNEQVNLIVNGGAEILSQILAGVGGFMVWWGRVTAKGPIIAAPAPTLLERAMVEPPKGGVVE